jgi:hypothetical protein
LRKESLGSLSESLLLRPGAAGEVSEPDAKEKGWSHLDGTVLENETTGKHDLLVVAGYMEVVGLAVVDDVVGDMAAVELHGDDHEFLYGICIRGKVV